MGYWIECLLLVRNCGTFWLFSVHKVIQGWATWTEIVLFLIFKSISWHSMYSVKYLKADTLSTSRLNLFLIKQNANISSRLTLGVMMLQWFTRLPHSKNSWIWQSDGFVVKFASSPCVYEVFHWVLWFPPAIQSQVNCRYCDCPVRVCTWNGLTTLNWIKPK